MSPLIPLSRDHNFIQPDLLHEVSRRSLFKFLLLDKGTLLFDAELCRYYVRKQM